MRNARGKIAGDVAKNKSIGRLFERALDVEIGRKERKNALRRRVLWLRFECRKCVALNVL